MSDEVEAEPVKGTPVPWGQYRDAVDMTMRQGERLGAIELLLSRWRAHSEALRDTPGFEQRANQLSYCISELRAVLRGGEP